MRKPVTHNLKIWPEHYSAVCAGVKRAELRKNDRDYRAGDILDLCEWDKDDESFTGEFISVTVTHVADVSEWMPGYVLLSIELALRERAEPVAYADPQAFRNFQAGAANKEWMWAKAAAGLVPVFVEAPPAQPVAVPDEHYQNLSELYHAQEKRLFKLAQRIKGHAFDKYSHSSSQAIDVLEAAIFGESDEAFRAAMLAAPGKQPLSVDVLAGALRNAPLAPSDSQGRQREKYAAIPLATDEDHWYLVSWCSPGGRYGSTEIRLNRPWSKGSMRSATKMIADYNDLEHANVVILSVFPIAAPQSTN
ncbi:DUF3850 domain-containing protein [Cronobacter malonaticus]|nr:DUF3850 domain-containing protein [Cronobacter malonaticus]